MSNLRLAGRFSGWRGKVCILSLSLLLISAEARSQQAPEVEQKFLRIEEGIRELREENDRLYEEVRELRKQLEYRENPPACLSPEIMPNDALEATGTGEFPCSGDFVDGFVIASANHEFTYRLGGCFKTRFAGVDPDLSRSDEFSLKKVRLETEFTYSDHYFLRAEMEYADPVRLKDGYIEYRYTPEVRLRFGQFIVPFTLEAHLTRNHTDFADGSIAATNMYFGARDIGVMLNGRLWDDLIRYRLAVVNGTGENKGDDNDAKDVASRVVLRPFQYSENEGFSHLCLGMSGTFGDQNTNYSTISFRTNAGTKFVDFADDTVNRGARARLGTELVLPYGPACLKAERMHMWLNDFQKPPVKEDLEFSSWYVSGSFLLTGETKCLGNIIPRRPFDPFKGTWGAFELAARYAEFRSEEKLFESGLATGTKLAQEVTLGLNWYFNEFVRATFNFDRTKFKSPIDVAGKSIDDENLYIVQLQVEF